MGRGKRGSGSNNAFRRVASLGPEFGEGVEGDVGEDGASEGDSTRSWRHLLLRCEAHGRARAFS